METDIVYVCNMHNMFCFSGRLFVYTPCIYVQKFIIIDKKRVYKYFGECGPIFDTSIIGVAPQCTTNHLGLIIVARSLPTSKYKDDLSLHSSF